MNNACWLKTMFTVRGLVSLCLSLLIIGCVNLPSNQHITASYVMINTQDTRLANLVRPHIERHPGQSGVRLLSDGVDAFVSRVALIRAAEVSIDIQYYIWKNDLTGRLLISELLQAADRGVRVRLLLDDLDTSGKDQGLYLINSHSKIEVRYFNAFAHRKNRFLDFLSDLKRVNNRMHNKSLTVDNRATIVGGRNIGNEYFGARSHAEFNDLDILAVGELVPEVSSMFDIYWNSKLVWPTNTFYDPTAISETQKDRARALFDEQVTRDADNPYADIILHSEISDEISQSLTKLDWADVTLLADAPDKTERRIMTEGSHIALELKKLLGSAKTEVLLVSPYFVPSNAFVIFLGDLVKQGVKVSVVTNSLSSNDVATVHAGYMRYRRDLLNQGVQLYEYKSQRDEAHGKRHWFGSSQVSLHSKTFIIDQQRLFVGSFNFDPRSVLYNTEMGVMIDSPKLAKQLTDDTVLELKQLAYKVSLVDTLSGQRLRWQTEQDEKIIIYDAEPQTSLWQRMAVQVQSIFVIEDLL